MVSTVTFSRTIHWCSTSCWSRTQSNISPVGISHMPLCLSRAHLYTHPCTDTRARILTHSLTHPPPVWSRRVSVLFRSLLHAAQAHGRPLLRLHFESQSQHSMRIETRVGWSVGPIRFRAQRASLRPCAANGCEHSHSHTYTRTHTHTHTRSHVYTHTYTLALTLIHLH